MRGRLARKQALAMAALVAVLLASPLSITDVGLWLTFGATAAIVSMSGRTVGAASSVRRGEECRIEHLALDDGVVAGPVVAAIARRSGAPVLRAFVPGPQPLLGWLLDRRFVIDDVDTFMATEPSSVPDQLAVVHPGLA